MRVGLSFLFALMAAGCALRPVPEQSTGVPTSAIVKHIRCEAREAIFITLTDSIALNPEAFPEPAPSIAARFRGHPELIGKFKPGLFTGKARKFLEYFWDTGIAYHFNLGMLEINNLDAGVNFFPTVGSGLGAFGFKTGFDRQRGNVRTFTLTDDFHTLLSLRSGYCDGEVVREDFVYPMAGKIGIEPFIHEFVRVALYAQLENEAEGGPPTMVDTITFQTTISGSVGPQIIFSPAFPGLTLPGGSLAADVSRQDTHTLTMGLSVVEAPPAEGDPHGKGIAGRLLTAKGTGKRQGAANAVDQELTRQALSQTVVLRP